MCTVGSHDLRMMLKTRGSVESRKIDVSLISTSVNGFTSFLVDPAVSRSIGFENSSKIVFDHIPSLL